MKLRSLVLTDEDYMCACGDPAVILDVNTAADDPERTLCYFCYLSLAVRTPATPEPLIGQPPAPTRET